MKKYRVWLEPDLAGVRFEEIIKIPENASEEEINDVCKDVAFNWIEWGDVAFNWIEWGYEPIEEVQE